MTRRWLLLLAALAGCAGGGAGEGSSTARTYRRAEVDRIRLQRLEVVVVTSGPPRVSEGAFEVRTFDPPELDAKLITGPEDEATRDALAQQLKEKLARAGFEVQLLTARAATSSATRATLREVLAKSDADGVLVVRAVPVDAFVLDLGTGTHTERTAFGKETIRDSKPVAHEGRLLVGQAFLFDRGTSLRLWTKQAPDYPDDGRLTPGHPFLRYGFVHEGPGPAPEPGARALLSAPRFVNAMLDDFPAPSAGSTEARAAIAGIDPEVERRRQEFLDSGHFSFEVGASHGFEGSEVALSLFGEELEPLGPGAVTPNGMPRVGFRASYLAAGGALYRAGLSYGFASSGFGRVYHLDNPSPNLALPEDRTAHVRVDSLAAYGVELGYGRFVQLSDHLALVPSGGPFVEVWSIEATPASVVTGGSRTRFGAKVGGELWLRATEGSPLDLRLGASGRAGSDTEGSLFLGYELSLGVGLLL